MKIINATRQNCADIAKIEKACFAVPWSEDELAESIEFNTSLFLATDDNGAALGYCGVQITPDGGYITNVAVLPQFRRNGVAASLLHNLFEFANESCFEILSLEVRKSNTAAIKLYEKAGFVPVGSRKNFYSEPREDAIIMTKYFKTVG